MYVKCLAIISLLLSDFAMAIPLVAFVENRPGGHYYGLQVVQLLEERIC